MAPFVWALGAVALAIAGVTVAGETAPPSHTLVDANPAEGSVVGGPPRVVELRFAEPPVAADSHVAVMDGDGKTIHIGPPVVVDSTLRQNVRGGDVRGTVTVLYHVAFAGGAVARGTVRFSVGAATSAVVAAPADTGHDHGGVDPVGATLLVVDAGVAFAVVLLLLLRPPRRPS